ncbi:MAG: DJ-1/PfpI family protein [Clostridia bacterium]|nr:DJ-1/PfpI family protein [Clostridia bacterium]
MIYEFLADGFELVEAMTPVDMLRRAGADIMTVSIKDDKAVKASNGVTVIADATLSELSDILPHMIILPGGMPGASNLRACKKVCELVTACSGKEIPIGAICAAPYILGELGLLKNREATCYPGFEDKLIGAKISDKNCVRDGHIITAAGMGAALPFSCELVSILYGMEKAEEILRSIIA